MFGGSERAPAIERRRNGPIVRPKVDCVVKAGAKIGEYKGHTRLSIGLFASKNRGNTLLLSKALV
jgi:hypothetical protein